MANILVTGGAGNIGSMLALKLSDFQEYRIIIADNLLTGATEKIPKRKNVHFIKCNINDFNDISSLFYAHKFDYVFHFAAVVGVKRTLSNPLLVFEDIKGIQNVLLLAKNTGVQRVFYSSSSEVYGEPFEIPQNEKTTPLNSRLPYAIVKNLAEAMCRAYEKEFGLPFTIFRFFNTYGPYQSEDFVVPRFIKKALANEDIAIYGDGSQTRTFCYITDNVETCIAILREGLLINDVVNIGSDVEITILDLAKLIIDITKSRSKIVFLDPLEEGDMTRRMPDNSVMQSILGRPLLPLKDGLEKLIEFYEKRQLVQKG